MAKCKCPAYPFPHRPGGGKCEADMGPVCSQCGHYTTTKQVDNDTSVGIVSECCEAEIVDALE